MMVRILDKMKEDRKRRIFDCAEKFIYENNILMAHKKKIRI